MLNAVRFAYTPQARQDTPIKGAVPRFGMSPQEIIPPPVSFERVVQYSQLATSALEKGNKTEYNRLVKAIDQKHEELLAMICKKEQKSC